MKHHFSVIQRFKDILGNNKLLIQLVCFDLKLLSGIKIIEFFDFIKLSLPAGDLFTKLFFFFYQLYLEDLTFVFQIFSCTCNTFRNLERPHFHKPEAFDINLLVLELEFIKQLKISFDNFESIFI